MEISEVLLEIGRRATERDFVFSNSQMFSGLGENAGGSIPTGIEAWKDSFSLSPDPGNVKQIWSTRIEQSLYILKVEFIDRRVSISIFGVKNLSLCSHIGARTGQCYRTSTAISFRELFCF